LNVKVATNFLPDNHDKLKKKGNLQQRKRDSPAPLTTTQNKPIT